MATVAAASKIVKVSMAGIDYAKHPDKLETLLGSCIGIAIWDRSTGIGALAHVVLAESRGETKSPGKFADTAVDAMLAELKVRGAMRVSLKAKLAGGSKMFGCQTPQDVGRRNYEAVLAELQKENIPVEAEHVGGSQGRVICFSPRDGSMIVKMGGKIVAEI